MCLEKAINTIKYSKILFVKDLQGIVPGHALPQSHRQVREEIKSW